MGPVNASLRFICELVALYGIAAGIWTWTDSVVLTVVAPVVAMGLWAVFRVPDDPGPPPVAVPGSVRLVIEAAVFGAGTLGLMAAHGPTAAVVFAGVLVVHYATTPRRLRHVLSSRTWGRPVS